MQLRMLAIAVLVGGVMMSLAAPACAATSVQAAIDDLTAATILVRTELKPCVTEPGLEAVAGAQLEAMFDTRLGEIDAKTLTCKIWKEVDHVDCTKDCSCSARSQLFAHFPDDVRTKLSEKDVEAHLAKMTDADYLKCRHKIAKICLKPGVKALVEQINAAK